MGKTVSLEMSGNIAATEKGLDGLIEALLLIQLVSKEMLRDTERSSKGGEMLDNLKSYAGFAISETNRLQDSLRRISADLATYADKEVAA